MKIERLVTHETAVGSPDRAERAILKVILAGPFFKPIQAVVVVREPLCDVETTSQARISLLAVI